MKAFFPAPLKAVSHGFLEALDKKLNPNDANYQTPYVGERAPLIAAAKSTLISRRTRHVFLESSLFSEPGWDMLLALYITEESDARNSITRLTDFSGALASTALRWIEHLGRSGLTRRVPHPTDDRTAFIELTDEGRYALDGYFTRVTAMQRAVETGTA